MKTIHIRKVVYTSRREINHDFYLVHAYCGKQTILSLNKLKISQEITLPLHLFVSNGQKRWTEIGIKTVHHQCRQKQNQTKGFVQIQKIKHKVLQSSEK